MVDYTHLAEFDKNSFLSTIVGVVDYDNLPEVDLRLGYLL